MGEGLQSAEERTPPGCQGSAFARCLRAPWGIVPAVREILCVLRGVPGREHRWWGLFERLVRL